MITIPGRPATETSVKFMKQKLEIGSFKLVDNWNYTEQHRVV